MAAAASQIGWTTRPMALLEETCVALHYDAAPRTQGWRRDRGAHLAFGIRFQSAVDATGLVPSPLRSRLQTALRQWNDGHGESTT